MTKMKKLLIGFIILSAFVIAGCGGSDSPSSPSHPPSISNLQFYPTSAKVNEGGGAVTVFASIDVLDAGGDIVSITIVTEKQSHTEELQSTKNKTSGTLTVVVQVDTTVAGIYPFSVFVTDSQGSNSNSLTGTFTIR